EVYIAILPGMGVASQLISTFSRKPIFGYKAMAYALMSIGLLGFMVWGHHMFMSGMSPYSAFAFSIMTMAIGVPSAIKTFNWLGTLWGGRIRLQTPMLFRSEEHTSELQSRVDLVCRLLLEKKKMKII